MAEKPPYVEGKNYIPARTDVPGEAPRTLRPGEIGTNEATGSAHVMRVDGRVSTIATAKGFSSIEVLPQSEYDALIAATATIATVVYIVTEDPT